MATKRLGRGLSAIIKTDVHSSNSEKGVTLLPLDSITTNPNQPRKNFEKDALSDLASSIKKKGVITPITVRRNGNGYMIVAGERRYRSSLIAGKKNIPAYILEVTEDSELMEIALIENIQREDLNAIEGFSDYWWYVTLEPMFEPDDPKPDFVWLDLWGSDDDKASDQALFTNTDLPAQVDEKFSCMPSIDGVSFNGNAIRR